MAIILYYLDLSPPVRAVRLAAKALGVELNLKEVNLLTQEHLTPQFLKMNPQHTIPVIDDDGVIIYDSHAICEYLSDKYGKDDKLFPKDLVKRAQINARLHFDTGFLFARMRFIFEPIFFGTGTEIPQHLIEYYQRCYPIMEGFLENSKYVCGNEITIADFSCISTIVSINQIVPVDADKYPKFLGWIERMSTLPDFARLCGDGGAACQQAVLAKQQQNILNKAKN